ncbi:MAG: hypothetical protein JW811_00740 [Clostridiales bacterium]|nr:hypothetical protein [Clostridiales bacterium]
MNWFYTDERGRVLAANQNDMSGNSGWVQVEASAPDPLTNADGVPLYRIDEGAIVSRSGEEIAADTLEPDPQQRPLEERVEVVEETTEAIATAVNQLLEG